MATPEIKTWQPGVADQPCKVAICKGDIAYADCVISRLHYIIFGGIVCAENLEALSGKQIVEAVAAFKKCAEQSIENGKKAGLENVGSA